MRGYTYLVNVNIDYLGAKFKFDEIKISASNGASQTFKAAPKILV